MVGIQAVPTILGIALFSVQTLGGLFESFNCNADVGVVVVVVVVVVVFVDVENDNESIVYKFCKTGGFFLAISSI